MATVSLATRESVLDALREAAQRPPINSEELNKQRVSYVYGFMDHSNPTTKAEVQRLVEVLQGA